MKKVIIPLILLIWLLKLFTSFNFLSNRCSKSLFASGAGGYNLSVFCSSYMTWNQTNFPRYKPFPEWWKLIISGNVDSTFLGFLLAAVVATFAEISKKREGFSTIIFCHLFWFVKSFLTQILEKVTRTFCYHCVVTQNHWFFSTA